MLPKKSINILTNSSTELDMIKDNFITNYLNLLGLLDNENSFDKMVIHIQEYTSNTKSVTTT